MIRGLAILATTLLASTTFASSADLIGKWTSPCVANQGQNNYQITAFDIQSAGNLVISATVFGDNMCTAPQGNFSSPATYTATDTTVQVTINDQGRVINITANYVINAGNLTLTPTAATVNGQPAQFDPNPMTFKRVP